MYCPNHVHFNIYFRSLSELDNLRLTGEAGDKIRQVTERATLFRITSNAMINVSVTSSLSISTSAWLSMYNIAMRVGLVNLYFMQSVLRAGQINWSKLLILFGFWVSMVLVDPVWCFSLHQACRDFLALAQAHSKRWQKALQAEREQRVRLEETLEQLAKQHNHLERAFRGAAQANATTDNKSKTWRWQLPKSKLCSF